jgi:oxygen-dependent protoporphyrinogen oxidase
VSDADVVVVGGGVAGLVVARDLARAGLAVTVLEVADRLGGCVRQHEVGGLRLDAGAESFATRSPAVLDLLDELGLGHDVVSPTGAGAWLQLPGRALALPATGVLGIPGSIWAHDVRAAIGVVGCLRAGADRVLPGRVGLGLTGVAQGRLGPSGSLGRLVRVRLGRRVLDRLVAPVVSGVHSAHPDEVDVDAVLPGVRPALQPHGSAPRLASLTRVAGRLRAAAPAGAAVAGLTGGMSRLVSALQDDLVAHGATIRTEVGVRSLRRDPDGRWAVETGSADTTLRAGTVVLAVPQAVALQLLSRVLPATRILSGGQTPVLLTTLVVRSRALDRAPRGTGVLVADDVRGVSAKALTHMTAKWRWLAELAGPGVHVLRLSYGRAGSSTPPPEKLLAVALHDAAVLLGTPIGVDQLVDHAVTSWETGLPHARPGHRRRVAKVRRELAATPGLLACGAWLAGTGLAAVVADARLTATQVLSATGDSA